MVGLARIPRNCITSRETCPFVATDYVEFFPFISLRSCVLDDLYVLKSQAVHAWIAVRVAQFLVESVFTPLRAAWLSLLTGVFESKGIRDCLVSIVKSVR